MIRNIFYTATQSIFPRNEKKKKKEFRWFIQRLQISLLYNDSFLEIFLRFSMSTSRCDQSRKKYQTLDEIYLRFEEESLCGKRRKK